MPVGLAVDSGVTGESKVPEDEYRGGAISRKLSGLSAADSQASYFVQACYLEARAAAKDSPALRATDLPPPGAAGPLSPVRPLRGGHTGLARGGASAKQKRGVRYPCWNLALACCGGADTAAKHVEAAELYKHHHHNNNTPLNSPFSPSHAVSMAAAASPILGNAGTTVLTHAPHTHTHTSIPTHTLTLPTDAHAHTHVHRVRAHAGAGGGIVGDMQQVGLGVCEGVGGGGGGGLVSEGGSHECRPPTSTTTSRGGGGSGGGGGVPSGPHGLRDSLHPHHHNTTHTYAHHTPTHTRSVVVEKARALLQLGMITEGEYMEVVVADRVYRMHAEAGHHRDNPDARLMKQQQQQQHHTLNMGRRNGVATTTTATNTQNERVRECVGGGGCGCVGDEDDDDVSYRDPITLEPLGVYRHTFCFDNCGKMSSQPLDAGVVTPSPTTTTHHPTTTTASIAAAAAHDPVVPAGGGEAGGNVGGGGSSRGDGSTGVKSDRNGSPWAGMCDIVVAADGHLGQSHPTYETSTGGADGEDRGTKNTCSISPSSSADASSADAAAAATGAPPASLPTHTPASASSTTHVTTPSHAPAHHAPPPSPPTSTHTHAHAHPHPSPPPPPTVTQAPSSSTSLTSVVVLVKTVTYNVDSLARFLTETGNFIEPTTRSTLGPEDVQAIGERLERAGRTDLRDQLAHAYAMPDRYRQVRERMDMLDGIDRCVGDVVTDMLALVEGRRPTHVSLDGEDDASASNSMWPEVRLCVLFSHFTQYFTQLVDTDPTYALQCLDQYARHLRGPPNKPTRDITGLLSACLTFLRDKEREATRKAKRKQQQQQR